MNNENIRQMAVDQGYYSDIPAAINQITSHFASVPQGNSSRVIRLQTKAGFFQQTSGGDISAVTVAVSRRIPP
jgi:hypothetical protein